MHPHPLPLGGRSARPASTTPGWRRRAGRRRAGGRPAQRAATSPARSPSGTGRRRGERGHVAGVPERERALEVDEVADARSAGRRARGPSSRISASGAIDSAAVPRRRRPAAGEERLGIGGEGVDDGRVELAAAPAPGHRDGTLRRRTCRWCTSATSASWATRISIGMSSPDAPAGQPAAVVALERVGQRPLDRPGRARGAGPARPPRCSASGSGCRAGRGRPASAWPSRAPADRSGSPRATLPSRNRRYGSPDQSTR